MRIGQVYISPDRVSGIVIACIALSLLIISSTAEWAFQETRDGLSVGFFPRITNIITIILAILVIILPAEKYPEKLAKLTPQGLLQAAIGLLFAVIFFILLQRIGFIYAAIPCLVIGKYLLGVRPWFYALLYGVVATGAVYALFYVLGFPLPGVY